MMTLSSDQLWEYGFRALTALGIIVTAAKSWSTAAVAKELHVSLNSRLTELLATKDSERQAAVEAATAVAHAAGLQLGQAQATHSIAEDINRTPPR